MTVSQGDIYTQIQELFQRGIVTVVGSGASCAYGLPSMSELAAHLVKAVPGRIASASSAIQTEWKSISDNLGLGTGLESTLEPTGISVPLLDVVSDEIAQCVLVAERAAIEQILGAHEHSPAGRLFAHILKASATADVITTNYDRLVEVHAARANVRVDTMFYGHVVGRFNATLSRDELSRIQRNPGRNGALVPGQHPHLRVSKPHGSLDWFTSGGEHFRTDLGEPGARRIIAPGGSKYRLGYEAPFDAHRNRANDAIDRAQALLFLGYGFNDEHLQTHLRSRFPEVRSLILSKNLTAKSREYLAMNPRAIGIEENSSGGCIVVQGADQLALSVPLWDLDCLLKEVLAL